MKKKYRFVFANTGFYSKTTHEIVVESSKSSQELFRDAGNVLDFCLFTEVRMFDEDGREMKELY